MWGLLGASAVAYSGSTDFMPEMNRWLQIVEMKDIVRLFFSSLFHSILISSLDTNAVQN